jgi:GTPase SAR1 family protein
LFIVYDITNVQSFEEVEAIFFEASKYSSRSSNAIKFLIGNKNDLEKNRAISQADGKAKSEENQPCQFIECSAKENTNLQQILEKVVTLLYER